jgi:hypothetical protein
LYNLIQLLPRTDPNNDCPLKTFNKGNGFSLSSLPHFSKYFQAVKITISFLSLATTRTRASHVIDCVLSRQATWYRHMSGVCVAHGASSGIKWSMSFSIHWKTIMNKTT